MSLILKLDYKSFIHKSCKLYVNCHNIFTTAKMLVSYKKKKKKLGLTTIKDKNGKLQITSLKFEIVWILYLKFQNLGVKI